MMFDELIDELSPKKDAASFRPFDSTRCELMMMMLQRVKIWRYDGYVYITSLRFLGSLCTTTLPWHLRLLVNRI